MSDKRSCFVALPFSPTFSVTEENGWQLIFDKLIRPAVESYSHPYGGASFSCERQETRQGRWVEEIADKLLTVDLAIIDLTDLNPNVCTELGIRLASGLPTVRISSVSTERLGNLAGHGVMKYHPKMQFENFEAGLHACMEEVLSSSRPAIWLSPERQLLSRRVQNFHRRAGKSLLAVSEVTATISSRQDEDGYFFYDFLRFCRYWGKSIAGGSLVIAIEPSMFRARFSEITRYGTWPNVAQPFHHHAAWPLFIGKDIGRARGWLEQTEIEISLGSSPGEVRLDLDMRHEEFVEILGDGTKVVLPKKVGETKLPVDQEELLLWMRFSGLFHPRTLPRMYFYPEGFVTGRWSVKVDAKQSDLGCSVMPLGDRSQFNIRRPPNSITEKEGSIEISPPEGSLLLPADGVLVSFFPPDSI